MSRAESRARSVGDLERGLREGALDVGPDGEPYEPTSWQPVDLGPALRGEARVAPPEFLARSDGRRLIYRGRAHSFWGPSESLKSWAAVLACGHVADAGGTAVYLDFEDEEVSFVDRCRTAGVADAHLVSGRIRYVRPEEAVSVRRRDGTREDTSAGWDLRKLKQARPTLAVIDGVSEAMAMHGLDVISTNDVAEYHAVLLRGFLEGTGTVEVDHTSKTLDGWRSQFGSQHKRAGLDGVSYEFKRLQVQGRGGHSKARIAVDKDRHAHVRGFAKDGKDVGILHVDDTGDRPRVWLEAPDERGALEVVRDRVGTWVFENPGASKTAIRAAVTGNNREIGQAADSLVEDGLLRVEKRGNARLYFPA